jgi:hypothetical protein
MNKTETKSVLAKSTKDSAATKECCCGCFRARGLARPAKEAASNKQCCACIRR